MPFNRAHGGLSIEGADSDLQFLTNLKRTYLSALPDGGAYLVKSLILR